ncbi:MAG: hypothetical protein HY646_02690 [Acidobacteria bacterium]|nr:hypothetical protein [Acidobacteriota bacterium]
MQQALALLLVLITSSLTYAITKRYVIGNSVSLRRAFQILLECIGTASVFLAINIIIGIFLILAIRSVTPLFLSVYLLNDALLIVLSFLEGFVFQIWWRVPAFQQ